MHSSFVLALSSCDKPPQARLRSRSMRSPGSWRHGVKTVECACSIEGQGPPVILVHGVGSRRENWAGVVERLKSDFRCVTYDLRGHGDSPSPDGPFGLDELIADLDALRARLGIEKAHVIGHSLGGMIAPAYARAHPDRVLSVGLLSTAAFRPAEDRAKLQAFMAVMREKGIAAVLDTLASRWFTDRFIAEHRDVVEARKRQVLDTDPGVYLNVYRLYAETEMGPWLHEVAAPALVLTGELDAGCNPGLNRQMAAALPNAELVILDGLKHSIQAEAPEPVAAHLARFLKAHT